MLCHHPISPDEKDAAGFIRAKKTIALLLLMFFLALEGYSFLTWLRTGQSGNFFVTFYTALVFSDILLVLLSLRYGIRFPVVFRNSGYALATVFLRVALTAPPYVNALIGICAGLYVLVINVAYNGYAALDRQC
ncbi:hypothetical protein DENIS_3864 [Desulfonema ishimotonii]|uniref:Uncharacterized protein n=1 Tax=Desulfonema ishimotonii TaxID=45657 RepID=A0A401G0Z6_9BACT|nr:hypothetical protein [Desulfonema ishimotonii]GBC62880.1 hypothetical protein DENIS_3864 [Desulfonema ishimotonii]